VEESNGRDKFRALALAVRDRLVERLLATEGKYQRQDSKRVYYLSIEFLIGRSLANNLHNLGIYPRLCGNLGQLESKTVWLPLFPGLTSESFLFL
jgi:glucan phosphorylase